MARSVDEFYGGATPPLPIGVLPAEDDEPSEAATAVDTTGARGPA